MVDMLYNYLISMYLDNQDSLLFVVFLVAAYFPSYFSSVYYLSIS